MLVSFSFLSRSVVFHMLSIINMREEEKEREILYIHIERHVA